MKLYATVKSERASKGQGGNDYIEVELKAYNRDTPVGHITIDTEDDNSQYIIKWYPDGLDGEDEDYTDPVILREGHITEGDIQCLREGVKRKVKKQKGELIHCKLCGNDFYLNNGHKCKSI